MRKSAIVMFCATTIFFSHASKAQVTGSENETSSASTDAAVQTGAAIAEVSPLAEESANEAAQSIVPAQEAAPVPAAVPTAAPAEPATNKRNESAFPITAGYKDGFFIQSPDEEFKLKIEGRLKARYTFQNTYEGEGVDREYTTSFSLPYARLMLTGNLFGTRLTYVFNPEFGGGSPKMILAYGDFAFIKDKLHLTFGQQKRPFSRNYLVSSVKRQFIDSPTGEFGNGIDIGLQLSNNYAKVKGLEWAVGIFNKSNPTKPSFSGEGTVDDEGNVTVTKGSSSNAVSKFSPALTLRLGFNNDKKLYTPTDLEGGPVRVGFAVSYHMDFDVDDNDAGEMLLSADFALKAYGLSLTLGVYAGWDDEGNVWDNPGYAQIGNYVQLGYFFADHFEPILRYGEVNPEGGDNMEQEITAGFTFFFYKQVFKLENNFSTFLNQGEAEPNFQFSSQLQLVF